MILKFKEKINGKPSFFIEKIWNSFGLRLETKETKIEYRKKYIEKYGKYWDDDPVFYLGEKRHTIRKDEKKRWRVGMDIHFCVGGNRFDSFQFAPVKKVVAIQEIVIYPSGFGIVVDGKDLNMCEMKMLIRTDGFDCADDFFNFFSKDEKGNPVEVFEGRLIHWTVSKY